MCAIFDEFTEAFDGEGDEDLGLGDADGEMEGNIIEIGDDLVDRNWRSCQTHQHYCLSVTTIRHDLVCSFVCSYSFGSFA